MLVTTQDNIQLMNVCPSESKLNGCSNKKGNTTNDSIVYLENDIDSKIKRTRKTGVKLGMNIYLINCLKQS